MEEEWKANLIYLRHNKQKEMFLVKQVQEETCSEFLAASP